MDLLLEKGRFFCLEEMMELLKNRIYEIQSLCEKFNVDKLWVFGSATTSGFSDKSDVDFLVSFEKMKPEDYAENYFLLAENLERILKRNVDLVTVNSLSNPYFIQSVEESKQMIYDRQNQKVFVGHTGVN